MNIKRTNIKGPSIGARIIYIGPTIEAYHIVIKRGMPAKVVEIIGNKVALQFYSKYEFLCNLSDIKL